MDKVDKIENELDEILENDDIPDEVLNEFVDETQDFFDSYVTARVELQTLQEMEERGEKSEKEGEKQTRRKRRRLGENVPIDIQHLVKAANQEYLNGDFLRAISLAKEAISINPKAPEPYNILSLIAEERESPDVALTFLEKAAENTHDGVELWIECARISKELGKVQKTVSYLKKAAKASPDDVDALLELYQLLQTDVNDNRSLNWTLSELTKRDPLNSDYAYELAMNQHQSGQIIEALNTLKNSVEAQISANVEVNIANSNLLSSGYLNESMNDEVLKLDKMILDAPPDFRINAAVAYIRKADIKSATEKMQPLSELSPSDYPEAFRLVADELIKAKFYLPAVDWLQKIQNDGTECRDDISYCYASAGKIEEAIDTMKQLIIDVPNLMTAPTSLYALMKENGREEEAIDWLNENSPIGAQSEDLIIRRLIIAHDNGDIDEFLELAPQLLSRILYDIYANKLLTKESRNVEEIIGISRPSKMNQFMMKILRYKRYNDGSIVPIEEDQLYSLACTCLVWLFNKKRNDEALVLGGLLVICREKLEKKQYFDVLFMFSLVAFAVGDGSAACNVMRAVVLENSDNDLVWEFFNVFIQKTPEEEGHAHKFLIRALARLPDCSPLQVMLGNHSQSTVWFDHAITQYLDVLKDRPEEPLVSLLLASAYLSKSYVRTQTNPRKSVLCSYASIRKYFDLRTYDFPSEAHYNMGRFYHTLGMFPQAEKMYRKVLESNVDYESIAVDSEAHDSRYNMKRDAAYNLSLILKESNPYEARRIMRKYLTIV